MTEKNLTNVQKIVVSGMCLALCMVLPFLGGNVQQVLNKISPMHFPVMICGFLCGGIYGAMVGFLAPILRCLLIGVPPLVPTALAMAFEMAVYGLLTGIFSRIFPKRMVPYSYITLIIAMIGGRIVWGLVSIPLYGMVGKKFTFEIFIASGFVKAFLAIMLQLLIIPPLIFVLERSRILSNPHSGS